MIEPSNINNIWNLECMANFVKFCSRPHQNSNNFFVSVLLQKKEIDQASKTSKFNIFKIFNFHVLSCIEALVMK